MSQDSSGRWFGLIIFGAIFLFALCVLNFCYLKSIDQIAKQAAYHKSETAQEKPTEDSEKVTEYFPSFYGYKLKITDAFIALFTLGLLVSTALLWWAAEKTAQRQLRAYVMVEKTEVTNVIAGQFPKFVITIKNFWQTPAKNLRPWCSAGIDAYPPTIKPPTGRAGDDKRHQHPLGPGGDTYVSPSLVRPLGVIEATEIKTGKAALYIVGVIFYEDAFGKERVTRYKLFHNSLTGENSMGACEDGNEYT